MHIIDDGTENRSGHVAMLLSLQSFEGFYGKILKLTWQEYVASYRNDFSFAYATALVECGLDVVLYLPSLAARGIHPIGPNFNVRFLPLATWFGPWSKWPLLSKTPFGRYVAQYANARAFEKPLRRALAEDSIDVVYVQEYWTARFDYLVSVLKLPIIGSDHGGRREKQLTFRKRAALRGARAITCQTIDEVEQVRAFGVEPVLLPNGVDVRFYAPDTGIVRTRTIATVARLTDGQKRVSDLIRAMTHLASDWQLQIAGTGPDENRLRALAVELGVQDRVEFLGFINDKQRVREIYRSCGVFAMASAYEGLPLAILEAMSCGSAVVVTAIRAFDDVVIDGSSGYKVPVGDPAALAAALDRAWTDRERLGEAARSRIEERFSLLVTARRLAELVSPS